MAQCVAKAKSTGKQCARHAIKGAKTCRVHGSGTRAAKAAARRRLEVVAAEEAVATLGLPVDVSPTDALLEEVRWTAGHVQWLRRQVQQLHDEHNYIESNLDGSAARGDDRPLGRHNLVWGTTKVVDKGSGENPGIDTTESAGASIWYELYERERRHLVVVCSAALKAGVEERRVKLAESQGEMVAQVIRAILAELKLSERQQALVADVVPRQLRLLAGGAG